MVGAAWYEPPPISLDITTDTQKGYLHNRFLDFRWRSQGPQDPNKEPHLHHLLRSRRHLRSYHVYCVLRKSRCNQRRPCICCGQLLHRICVILGRLDSGILQPDLWCRGGDQRKWCSLSRCCRPKFVRIPLLLQWRQDANKFCRFVKILVIEIFSSVLGLFGLIIGLLVVQNASQFE